MNAINYHLTNACNYGWINLAGGERFGRETDCEKICIFGGHETWKKGLKKYLPGAKFINSGDLHSLDVIRNSKEIWIQPNAISHSFFKKVLGAARQNNVEVCYFKYAGVRKCAEQVKLKKLP